MKKTSRTLSPMELNILGRTTYREKREKIKINPKIFASTNEAEDIDFLSSKLLEQSTQKGEPPKGESYDIHTP